MLLGGCGGSTTSSSPPSADAGPTLHDATIAVTFGDDSAVSASSDDGAADAGTSSAPWGPDPPVTACAQSGPPCPSPPPACANSYVAVSYSSGQCMAGVCSWQKADLDCREVDASCAGAARFDAGLDVSEVDGSTWINVYGCQLPAPVVPVAPTSNCDVDASPDSGVCPPPASTCVDEQWLAYYDDGQCLAGVCSWEKRVHYCPGHCAAGGCRAVESTAPPPPPLDTTAK
jgi:hypothetical protein